MRTTAMIRLLRFQEFFARISIVAFAVLLLGVGSELARAQDAPPGNAANGKRVYLADGCFTCHGRAGQGGNYNGAAPALAQIAMPFEAFRNQLRAPANEMPAYAEAVMSDGVVADIYAFVQSLPGPRPAKDIAILND
jgi:mono/diheme cytochrome c family protein